MTAVVADSSPLNDLTLIGSVDVLRELYGSVVVPQRVVSRRGIRNTGTLGVRAGALKDYVDLPTWISRPLWRSC